MTSIRSMAEEYQDAVYAECRAAQSEGREISDGCARTIATWYHDPSPSGQAGSAFSHTGAIADPTDDTYRSLVSSPSLYTDATADDRLALDMLGTYLINHGPRGPVDGWDNVWVETNGGHAD